MMQMVSKWNEYNRFGTFSEKFPLGWVRALKNFLVFLQFQHLAHSSQQSVLFFNLVLALAGWPLKMENFIVKLST
jgi:hypothetical protein